MKRFWNWLNASAENRKYALIVAVLWIGAFTIVYAVTTRVLDFLA